MKGMQDVGVAPGEASGRGLSAGIFVDLLVDAATIILDLRWK